MVRGILHRLADTKQKIMVMLGVLLAANILIWLLTWGASRHYAFLLATGLLAYGFGLRHAVDADHISAIDNTTRKLMQEGKRPAAVGLFFSLGHSTVVILLCAALALSTAYVERHIPQWKTVGSLVGTLVSSFFLYLIGVINLIVLWDLSRALRRVLRGEHPPDQKIEEMLEQRGLVGRLFRPLLRLVRRSWHMYFVGFLFGLGFDTASEVGILALSARSGQSGVPFWTIMLLPLLFTVGMSLVDALDGVLMLGAYGWAYIQPVRKLYYNVSITTLSVLVAFVVGTYELLQTLIAKLSLRGGFWTYVGQLSFDNLGYFIIGTFLLGWACSAALNKLRKYRTA